MKLKINETTYDVDTKEMHFLIQASMDLEGYTGRGFNSIDKHIEEIVSKAIAENLFVKLESEVMNRIDVESIVKRVQLVLVDNIARGR